jgi:hypothetical protein
MTHFILLSLFFGFCVATKYVKLCVHCKHFINSNPNNLSLGKCALFPKADELSEYEKYKKKQDLIDYLVTGRIYEDNYNKEKDYYFCSTSREFKSMCGEDGELFVQKKK